MVGILQIYRLIIFNFHHFQANDLVILHHNFTLRRERALKSFATESILEHSSIELLLTN